MKTSKLIPTLLLGAATAAIYGLSLGSAAAQYSPVFYDGYDVSMQNFDVNFEHNNGIRQGGILSPVSYTQSPAGSDYHHQLGYGPLLLAGDAGPTALVVGTVSPNYNFKGTSPFGVVGTKMQFSVDVNATTQAKYTYVGASIGGSSSLIASDAAVPHFGLKFVEDTQFGAGNLIQLFDGNTLIGNFVNPAGTSGFNVELSISDSGDGNPWDGIGQTSVEVLVNGNFIHTWTKGGGGYSDNFLTFEGNWGYTDGFTIATHTVDNLTVYASVVPEPSTAALGLLAVASVLGLRRRR